MFMGSNFSIVYLNENCCITIRKKWHKKFAKYSNLPKYFLELNLFGHGLFSWTGSKMYSEKFALVVKKVRWMNFYWENFDLSVKEEICSTSY